MSFIFVLIIIIIIYIRMLILVEMANGTLEVSNFSVTISGTVSGRSHKVKLSQKA